MVSLIVATAAASWFGPLPVTLGPAEVSNPYDWQNRPEVVLRQKETRLVQQAFYDDGFWKARVVVPSQGSWTAQLQLKGRAVGGPVTLRAPERARHKGFVRIDPKSLRFKFDDGSPYWPMGFNLGWGSDQASLEPLIGKLGKNGLNWGRIWACHWDNKNPFWPTTSPKPAIGRMDPGVLAHWDRLVSASERAGINFQFVLFHHGPYSTRVNSNWGEHPWNAKNGGFLKEPGAFFTNVLARNLAKSWLREAVARWGYSPSVMSWELFNEVEWVDNRYDGRIQQVADWHAEMATYLREIDPVGRLVTTSSDLELPIYKSMDYLQPHGYVPSVEGLVLGQKKPKDKPLFFGEVGPNGNSASEHRLAARDGLWTSLLSGQPGAAQYWFWDRIERDGILAETGRSAALIKESGILTDPNAKPFKIAIQAPSGGELKLIPGRGWTKTEVDSNVFNLPQDAPKFGGVSSYFQGTGHREMHPESLIFNFKQPEAGKVILTTGPVSAGGGALELWVNGKLADSLMVAAGQGDRQAGKNLMAMTPAGSVQVEIKSNGSDWIQVTSIGFSGLAPAVTGLAYGSQQRVLIRLKRSSEGPATIRLSGLPLGSSMVQITSLDLQTGRKNTIRGSVQNGALRSAWNVVDKDSVLLIAKL